ncbi:MAG: acetyl-CoA carboxylase carboxyltransferase subunit beta [Alphaproteobacteria bacterium]|nr:acetyl-CoA carboxylase carboxyltransferase subunit beta [Alphaproteobacteria bacterium]
MNWLTNLPPGLKSIFARKDEPESGDSLWVKCPKTGELVYREDLEAALWVTPSGAHMRITPEQRFKYLFDGGIWSEIGMPSVIKDPLKFKDDKRYVDRLKSARAKTGRDDCMVAAHGEIGGRRAVVLVQDFAFMGGSLGMAAGEAFITAAETAVAKKAALVVVTASGGARMQESSFALMQMPRTVLAIQDVKQARLPYIVILSDPTSGGVLASYAMLGDVHMAEPGAQLAFTGPRVIEQTIREKLPEGFQRSEFLRERGMVDIVVHRRDLTSTLGAVLGMLMAPARTRRPKPVPAEELAAAK